MAIHADNITDLANATLEELGEDRLTDIATDLQEYTACERLIPKAKAAAKTGTSCRFNLIYQGDGNTKPTSMFGVDNVDHVDGTITGDVPWRMVTTGMSFDVAEKEINEGPREIYNFIKTKRYQRDISWVEKMEEYFWDGPSGSGDALTPFGLLKYWLDYDATEGFNGGNHASFSGGPAGVDCATYSNWSHRTANYSAVSDTDLVDKMRTAVRLCKFKGIPRKPIPGYESGYRYGVYTTNDTLQQLEDFCRAQNDNLGSQLAMYQDAVMIKSIPVEWVPYLESNHATSDPVIGIDWSTVSCVPLKNSWMVESPFKEAPNQHTVRVSHMDCRFNFVVQNRRRLFLIAKSDPMSD
jgi:hypothetical protein